MYFWQKRTQTTNQWSIIFELTNRNQKKDTSI